MPSCYRSYATGPSNLWWKLFLVNIQCLIGRAIDRFSSDKVGTNENPSTKWRKCQYPIAAKLLLHREERWTNFQHWAARMSVLTVLVSNYVLFAFALRFTRDFQALFETAFEYCVTLVYWKVVRLFKSKLQCDFCLNSGSGVYAAMFRTRRMQLLRGKQEVLAIQQNISNLLRERLSRFHGWKQSSGIARTFHWTFMECCSFSVHGNFQFVRMRLEGL